MKQTIYLVDAFASRPFTGNPAAVCLLAKAAEETWMQQVAMEMNQAETAFLIREADGYRLRWLTPLMEVDLCGHATLAAAHTLWETGEEAPGSTIVFQTRSGRLTAQFIIGGWIELDFPAERETPCEPPDGLFSALNVESGNVLHVGKNRFDYLVQIENSQVVRSIRPDYNALARIPSRGIIVTALSSDSADCDFVSRFFAPAAGISEDPVTGSAHCCLAPFWQDRLHKSRMLGYQASARGGYVRVECRGDRVLLGGQAVTTMRGELA